MNNNFYGAADINLRVGFNIDTIKEEDIEKLFEKELDSILVRTKKNSPVNINNGEWEINTILIIKK